MYAPKPRRSRPRRILQTELQPGHRCERIGGRARQEIETTRRARATTKNIWDSHQPWHTGRSCCSGANLPGREAWKRRPENSCWPGCELLGWLVVEASRASLAAVMGLEWRTTFVCIPTRGSGSIQAFVVMGSSFWSVTASSAMSAVWHSLLNLFRQPTKRTAVRRRCISMRLLSAVVQRIIARLSES